MDIDDDHVVEAIKVSKQELIDTFEEYRVGIIELLTRIKILEDTNKSLTQIIDEKDIQILALTDKKRKPIPKAIRNKVWDNHMGKNNGSGLCHCCEENEIDSKHFECGHVVSVKNGGADNLSNLRPICEECNKYMGSDNMNDYKNYIKSLSN